jgi:hypothetical protein
VSQSYTLPKELKLEDLKSNWTDDGMLIIEAPLPKQLEGESSGKGAKGKKNIQIEHGSGASQAGGYGGSDTSQKQSVGNGTSGTSGTGTQATS